MLIRIFVFKHENNKASLDSYENTTKLKDYTAKEERKNVEPDNTKNVETSEETNAFKVPASNIKIIHAFC